MTAANFLARLPSNASANVRETIVMGFGLVDRFREKAAIIRADRHLSDAGKADKLRSTLASGIGEHFGQLRRDINQQIDSVFGEIGRLRDRAVENKFDPALKRETRDFLRSLEENERRRLIFETDERLIHVAILEAPAFLTQVDSQTYQSLEKKMIVEGPFGDRLGQLEGEHAALVEAQAALTVAGNEMMREAGVNDLTFNSLAS